METYAIANQKGGVGKTTITLAMAGELVRGGAAVVVVDLDPQASATKVLGVDVDERPTVADVMLEPDRFVLDDVLVTTDWGFTLAPAETALASRESRRVTADEFILRRQLQELDSRDVVLVDCPPSLGLLTINALTAASHLIVVTEPSSSVTRPAPPASSIGSPPTRSRTSSACSRCSPGSSSSPARRTPPPRSRARATSSSASTTPPPSSTRTAASTCPPIAGAQVWQDLRETFARRHVLVHRDGIVDQKFLNTVPTSGLAVGQRLVITRADAERALDDVETTVKALAAQP